MKTLQFSTPKISMRCFVLFLLFYVSIAQLYSQDVNIGDTIRFVERISDRDTLIQNPKLKDKELVIYLSENIADKDSIISILRMANHAYESQLNRYKHEIEIKNFFCCTDTTVFKSNFVEIEINDYPQFLQEYYDLIVTVRKLERNITELEQFVEQTVSEIANSKYSDELKESMKRESFQTKAAPQLREIRELLIEIKNDYNTSLLSPKQKEFYNTDLLQRYRNLSEIMDININNEQE